MDDQILTLLRGQLADIIAGTVFLTGGLATCAIALIRRQRGVHVLAWLGIWSAMYGTRLLVQSRAVVAALPAWAQAAVPLLDTSIAYLIVVAATLAWLGLSRGPVRLFLQVAISVGLVIAAGGIGGFLWTGATDALMLPNNFLAVCSLLVLVTVVTVPTLACRFLVLPEHAVLSVGSIVFAVEALYANLARPLHLYYLPILGWLGFAVLLVSFGYAAVRMTLASERRLLAIEHELQIARRLQFSILPTTVPELRGLRVVAAYEPMTEVAGDFYEFLAVDDCRAGLLVADVSGHGVPAALIASMIKVAVQSVVPVAHDPGAVLRGLGRMLTGQLRERLVSAAYLWLDTERRQAWYSAAGHPPLVRWRDGRLERFESNGPLFGIVPDADYPVRELRIEPGDRFLLYTDGVIEPENARGEFFGDAELERVVRHYRTTATAEFSDRLLSEIRRWRPAAVPQQDDITLVVVDVLE